MKSSMCDVEIRFSVDGTETVEPVPECLKDVFLTGKADGFNTNIQNNVTLPKRYAKSLSVPSAPEGTSTESGKADDNYNRARDMRTAIEWIKQEIAVMKEQDRALCRRFVSLRSSILQLQCRCDLHSSTSDLSTDTLDNSSFSLDERRDSPCSSPGGFMASPVLDLTEFRSRTSSLLLPQECRCAPILRIKWKSDDYL